MSLECKYLPNCKDATDFELLFDNDAFSLIRRPTAPSPHTSMSQSISVTTT